VNQHPSTTVHNTSAAQHQPVGKHRRNVALLVLAVIAGLLIGLLAEYVASDIPIEKQPELLSMSQCVTNTLGLFDQKKLPTPETLRDAREHCYSLIQAQQLLSDFAIRRLDFFQQYRANGVFMLLVVVVTVSGVVLAGVQLWASYQLAAANKTLPDVGNGEMILRGNQLVLRSSITGLFILLISFCFFLVFVLYVYRLETPADNHSIPPTIPTLSMGGLGPPPEKGKP